VSFSLNFHRDHDIIDRLQLEPYKIEHTDFDAITSPIGRPYTTAKVSSGGNYVIFYLEYGERLDLRPAPAVREVKPELVTVDHAELVGAPS
jgi:hypothetical protein